MHGLHVVELIGKKAGGHALTSEEIQFLVDRVTSHHMDQVQLGAILMAIYLRGMTLTETTDLTSSMTRSGQVLSWPSDWTVVDKHSTGGVGDKVSLPLTPALAACGFKVPMISGRGLGHTGGTLDKLESIPGFRVDLTPDEIYTCLEKVGCCITGQTADIVPADRILYQSRDVTHTVDSIPLITSSIISKKAAEGLNALVLDVKYGSGALMKEMQQSHELAQNLVDAANGVGVRTAALLTNMDRPVGRTVGNALEVWEAVQCLQGAGPADLADLVTQLAGQLFQLTGRGSAQQGRQRTAQALADGSALRMFRQMLVIQGVREEDADELCYRDPWKVLPQAKYVEDMSAPQDGYVSGIDALTVARLCGALGAGKKRATDKLDYAVGIALTVCVGDHVKKGQAWAKIHHSGNLTDKLREGLQSALTVNSDRVMPCPRVAEVVQKH